MFRDMLTNVVPGDPETLPKNENEVIVFVGSSKTAVMGFFSQNRPGYGIWIVSQDWYGGGEGVYQTVEVSTENVSQWMEMPTR